MNRMPFRWSISWQNARASSAFAAHFEFFPRGVLRAHGHVLRARDVAAKSGNRKAALLFALLALGVDDFRIRADDFGFRIFAVAHVDHCQAQADPDLRRRQAHALRRVHRLEHVRDERLQFLVEFFDALAGVSSTGSPYLTMG